MSGQSAVVIERVVKLDSALQNLERELKSVNRKHPLVFLHPSRLPSSSELNSLVGLATNMGQGVEFDVRATATGYVVQQGMFTDRLKAWSGSVTGFEKLEGVIGTGRVRYLIGVVEDRLKEGEGLTFETFKGKLLARDLTTPEFDRIARLGMEEIVSYEQFFDMHRHSTAFANTPAKLMADFKDSDMTVAGNISVALNGLVAVIERAYIQFQLPNVHMVLWYDLETFNKPAALLHGRGPTVAVALPSDLIKKKSEQAFAEYARDAVAKGVRSIGVKITELGFVDGVLSSGTDAMVYVPPLQSQDPKLIVEALRKYPSISAVQIDA